jgi:hypothetical protein
VNSFADEFLKCIEGVSMSTDARIAALEAFSKGYSSYQLIKTLERLTTVLERGLEIRVKTEQVRF